jgi:hypothetical protein
MREPSKKTIDGVTFEVTPLGHKKARKAFMRLSKAIGPALAGAAGSGDVSDLTGADVNIAAALGELVNHVSDEDLEWFSDVFGRTTRFSTDGQKWPFLDAANREVLFSGRLLLFFHWLAFALEENFSDFLDWLRPEASADGPGGPLQTG